MAHVIQFQRRALETFASHPEAVTPPAINKDTLLVTPGGDQLFIAGISEGIGTCSDIHGMNVLVLTDREPHQIPRAGMVACAYTVLLRSPTEDELNRSSRHAQGIAQLCVELVIPAEAPVDDTIMFKPTGTAQLYTNLV